MSINDGEGEERPSKHALLSGQEREFYCCVCVRERDGRRGRVNVLHVRICVCVLCIRDDCTVGGTQISSCFVVPLVCPQSSLQVTAAMLAPASLCFTFKVRSVRFNYEEITVLMFIVINSSKLDNGK